MKKLFSAALSVLIMFFSAFLPSFSVSATHSLYLPKPHDLLYGDADLSNSVTINDALDIQRELAECDTRYTLPLPAEWKQTIRDTDGNGKVNVHDVTELQRFLAEIHCGERINHTAYSWESMYVRLTYDKLMLKETEEFLTLKPPVASFLADTDYTGASSDYSTIDNYCGNSSLDKPSGLSVSLPVGAATIAVFDMDGSNGWSEAVSDSTYVIKNLIPERIYGYVVIDSNGMLLKAGRCRAHGDVRIIDLGGLTFNIRDIGGWTCDGGTLKYGLVYRGCEIDSDNYGISLTQTQKAMMTDAFEIRDDIDLRGNSEVDGPDKTYGTADDITASPLDCEYIRYPVAPYHVGLDIRNPYQRSYYASLLKRIAHDASEGRPCYIHCMAGADRTGTLCALIEAICGVSQSDIEKEYELTSFASGNTRRRSSNAWQQMLSVLHQLPGNTLSDCAVSYALQAGVTMNEINLLRASLIDGSPRILYESAL